MTGARIHRDMEELRRTVRARSSITGRFVKIATAIRHPRTTILERRKQARQRHRAGKS